MILPKDPEHGKPTHSWRKKTRFCTGLQEHLQYLITELETLKSFRSLQQIWDWIKGEVKLFVKSFQQEDLNWRKQQLKRLQSKRNRILRQQKNRNLTFPELINVEIQIASFQQSIAEIEILKAGKFWREHREKSAGFLKRITKTREGQREITSLLDPLTNTQSTQLPQIKAIAKELGVEQQEALMAPILLEEIVFESRRSPKSSNPGSDGLPYEILHFIVTFQPLQSLIHEIYQDALMHSKFPDSWNTSIMSLLPKKGDLTDIRNYRPSSLANTDCKIFTRILNHRMMSISSTLNLQQPKLSAMLMMRSFSFKIDKASCD
ncbi:uncharacterized protein EV154DRAFT_567155 [Mucor mucedo]|uniref:uncharacterized protein n=1 Tax=Mucor mucedo TaxID=29922 RepID=UPI00222105A0|nr:uncharacterized protein EV154DRAFT_567155 [Mucor mucedo]KAI7887774.1 hypothetical protein EV154DRAFT_567155 [Mucor mucedo]